MPALPDIEQAVAQLSPDDLRSFRAWFAEHDARLWDQQFAEDVAQGRLDALADEALTDIRQGRGVDL